jgi:DNA polymerase-3 subunit beta
MERNEDMRFSCEKALMLSAVQTAARAVSTRSTIAALEGLLISAEDDTLTVTGYNLETGIRSKVPAGVREAGSVVVAARLLGDMVRRLPDDRIEFEADESGMVHIVCGNSRFDLAGMPAAEFPEMPVPSLERSVRLSSMALRNGIGLTLFAVSDNENKQIHTGLLFDIEGGAVTLVGVDGFRLAMHKAEVAGADGEAFSFVVPGSAMREIERILEPSEDVMVDIALGKQNICFTMGGTVLISRLLDGKFLNYKQSIPQDHAIFFEVSASALRDSVERVSLMINDKIKNPVRCLFESGSLKLSCATTVGRADDICPIDGEIEDALEIGFNNRYLLDALRASGSDRVKLLLKNNLSPMLMVPAEGDAFTFMVLPIRLKA